MADADRNIERLTGVLKRVWEASLEHAEVMVPSSRVLAPMLGISPGTVNESQRLLRILGLLSGPSTKARAVVPQEHVAKTKIFRDTINEALGNVNELDLQYKAETEVEFDPEIPDDDDEDEDDGDDHDEVGEE